MVILRGLVGLLLLLITLLGSATIKANPPVWQALQEGGQVILMRHALAPGVGDPDNFERGNCATQRNLSDQGRTQAAAIGEAFRVRSIAIDTLYSSHWCRALETAELMALGDVQTVGWLDSFFIASERYAREQRTREARQQILDWQGPGNLLLVTHQVNITALAGRGVASGDMVVVRPDAGELAVIGRLEGVH